MEKRSLTFTLLQRSLLGLAAFLLMGSTLFAQSYSTTSALPAFITTGSPFDLEFNVTSINAGNEDLEVTLSLDHTWASDLEITLIAPDGSSAVLVADQGGATDMTGTTVTFSSSATTANSDFGTCAGGACTILPEGSFTCLDYSPGTWLINVNDDAGGDDGNITAASIEFVPGGSAAPAAYGSATATSSGPLPIFIPSNATTTLDFNVGGVASADFVKVDLDLDHTWAGDLEIVIEAPDGSTATMIDNIGGNIDLIAGDIMTIEHCGANGADMAACGGASCSLAIQDDIAAFMGALPGVNGLWQLHITDTATGDQGNVNAASISFAGAAGGGGGGGAGGAAIPTMSEWGLFLFALLMINLGLVFLYRQRVIFAKS